MNAPAQLQLPVLFSEDSERAVIGALLTDPEATDRIADKLHPRHFFVPTNAVVYEVILAIFNSRRPVDAITVADMLDKRGALEAVGGLTWLAEVAWATPGAANIKRHAEIIIEKAMMRGGIQSASSLIDRLQAGDWDESPSEVLQEAAAQIEELADTDDGDAETLTASQVAHSAVREIHATLEADGMHRGVATHLEDLDRELNGGLRNGDLVIVAGRPGMGKTVLAMNIAEETAKTSPVAVFSMEMGKEQLGLRQIASLGSVPLHDLMSANIDEDGQLGMVSALSQIDGLRLEVDFRPALTVAQVRAKCRKLRRKHGGLALIVVDYLQLMQHPGADGRVNEITKISGGLKAIAKEMNCPVIALSQLSRKVEERADKHPQMADLRESGSIEQDADIILFAYRDDYYHPDSQFKGIAEIGIAKQRMGQSGKWVRAQFQGQFSRFRNLARDWVMPDVPVRQPKKGGFE